MLPNLKLLRRERGISQQALAEAIGTSQQSINQYENHSTEPDIQTLIRMADFFNTSVDYLVAHTDIRSPFDNTVAYHLNSEEATLIGRYRELSGRERRCVNCVVDTLIGQ